MEHEAEEGADNAHQERNSCTLNNFAHMSSQEGTGEFRQSTAPLGGSEIWFAVLGKRVVHRDRGILRCLEGSRGMEIEVVPGYIIGTA